MRFRASILAVIVCGLLTSCLAAVSVAAIPTVQDIVIGSGSPGPFTLSWKGILANTESISINNIPQVRGLDYTLDAANGTLTLTRPLPATSAAEITYTLDPTQAQRNGSGQTIPLSVDLMRTRHGYFSLNALGQQGAPTGNNLTVGIGLGLSGGQNSQISSHFYYTPTTAALGTDPNAAPNIERADARTALSLTGSANTGGWGQFSFGFARAGVCVADTGDSAIQAGRQTLTLNGKLSPAKRVQAQISFSRADPLEKTSVGNATNSSLALTLTPTDKTNLQASVAQTGTTTSGMTQTVGVSASSQATKTLHLSAGFNGQNAPGSASDSQAITFQTTLTPSKTYALVTSAGQSRLGTATTNQQAVTLALTPLPAMQLNAGFLMRQKAVSGTLAAVGTSEATIGGTVRPLSFLEVSGTYKSRIAPVTDTNPNDLFDTSSARIAFAPLRTFKVVGTYDQNPDDAADTIQRLARRGVGLETSFGALGISGGCDWSRAYATPDVEQTIHADLGLRFSAASQLTVGYQTQQNRLDATVPLATAYTVGFTHTLGDRVTFSLNGKRQQSATAAPPDYNASANLGVKF